MSPQSRQGTGNHSPFRTAETADTLVMGLFSGQRSPFRGSDNSGNSFRGGRYGWILLLWACSQAADHRQPSCSQVDYLLCICSQLPAGCLIPGHHTHRNTLAGELARELAGKSRLKRERSANEARETAVIRTENGSIFRKGPGLSAHRVDHRRQHIGTRREGVPDELRGGLVPFHWKGLKRV